MMMYVDCNMYVNYSVILKSYMCTVMVLFHVHPCTFLCCCYVPCPLSIAFQVSIPCGLYIKIYILLVYSFTHTECCLVLIYILMIGLYVCILNLTDPLGCIIDRLKVRRPKQRIIEKLLEMGLIQDRKELRKKRVKKSEYNAFPGKLWWGMLQYS